MINPEQQLAAFFHDPLDKPLCIPGHKERAAEQADALGVNRAEAATADRVASAADRIFTYQNTQGEQIRADFAAATELTHPLGGERMTMEMFPRIDRDRVKEALHDFLGDLKNRCGDNREKMLLTLWREFPESKKLCDLELEDYKLGQLWNLLPADTRVPDHSLLAHNWLTAALDSCGPEPMMVKCWLGPVQGFIGAARRTEDFWMGSYLLAYLVSRAVIRVIEELGPGHLIFPQVKGNPLIDLYLRDTYGISVSGDLQWKLFRASLPNTLYFIAPPDRFDALMTALRKEVNNEWMGIVDAVIKHLKLVDTVADQARRQAVGFLEFGYAAVQPPGTQVREFVEQRLGRPMPVGGVTRDGQVKKGDYTDNLGTFYAEVYEYLEQMFISNKLVRQFKPASEQGFKCSQCGDYSALAPDEGTALDNQALREYWKKLAENAEGFRLTADGSDRLCGICLAKRFALPAYFNQRYAEIKGFKAFQSFPSAGTVATWTFKRVVLEKWDVKVSILVRNIVDLAGDRGRGSGYAPRQLRVMLKNERFANDAELADKFLRVDGQWLLPALLDREEVSENDRVKLAKKVRELGQLIDSRPARYYAIVRLDGDKMGEWLTGTHPGWPKWRQVLHTNMVAELGNSVLLDEPRTLGPSAHAFISAALNNYALDAVQEIVECEFAGKLVYAGGDDVLAFLPVEDALACAEKLRFRFSGQVGTEGAVDLGRKTGYATRRVDGKSVVVPTLGPRATMSAGIVIAHCKFNLAAAVTRSQGVEHIAKEKYDRDALAVTICKRSGGDVSFGAKWLMRDGRRTVEALNRIVELVRQEKLSRKFATAAARQLLTVIGMDEIYKSLLMRAAYDHAVGSKAERRKISETVTELLYAVSDAAKAGTAIRDRHQVTIELLVAVRFLALLEEGE